MFFIYAKENHWDYDSKYHTGTKKVRGDDTLVN